MTMLAGLMGARHAVEVGTFTGYSPICLRVTVAMLPIAGGLTLARRN
jgi:predicted O-methyltransferase YrrM